MLKSLLTTIRTSRLAIDISWIFIAQGFRTIVQGVYFILIARSLGAEQYGTFIGICAFIAISTPFVDLGTGTLLIKDVSRDPDTFGRCWGKALVMILMTGSFLLLLILAMSRYALPASIPRTIILLVALSDIFFNRFVDVASQAFQAVNRLNNTALLQMIPTVLRLLAITGLALYVKSPSVFQWTCLYLLTAVISGIFSLKHVSTHIGPPILCLPSSWFEVKQGAYFAVSGATVNIYNDIDKTMLARFSTLQATGIYGVAYRIIDIAFIPVRSLFFVSYPRFFRYGKNGIHGLIGFTKHLFPFVFVYSIICCILVMVLAPIFPHILGPRFIHTTSALRWLAPLLILKGAHGFAADTLTGADYQGARTIIQVFVACFNVTINLWIISLFSWKGAAISSLLSDGCLALALWATVIYHFRKTSIKSNIGLQINESRR